MCESMGRKKVDIELITHLCSRALRRSRARYYYRCWKAMVDGGASAYSAKEKCSELAGKVMTFTKEDFEIEARKYIAEKKAWRLRLSTLLRTLRRLASDKDEAWIEWYKGDYGRRRGIYRLKYVEGGQS